MQTITGAPSAVAPRENLLAWKRSQLRSGDWLVPALMACAEFEQIANAVRGHAGPLAAFGAEQLGLPACTGSWRRCAQSSVDGPGFAVLDRVPVERYRCHESQAIGWVLANLMGQVVAQKRDGIVAVRRARHRQGDRPGVRRSVTNLEQEFHTDGGWLPLPPTFSVCTACSRRPRAA